MCLFAEDPFNGTDLATVPFEMYDWLLLAREAAEDAEVELFDPAIEDATAEGDTWLSKCSCSYMVINSLINNEICFSGYAGGGQNEK